MKLSEAVKLWPPSAWVASYGPNDNLMTDPSKAVIKSARIIKNSIDLTVRFENLDYGISLACDDPDLMNRAVEILNEANGKTIGQLGDPDIL
ncbi:hypothetical protein L0244_03400 [bacterium]|nr:hypothetical protein [bacterium]